MKSSIILSGVFGILISIVSQSCKNKNGHYNQNMRDPIESFRRTEIPLKSDAEQWLFYDAIYGEESDKVQAYLNKGFDPNYCHGECGWVDSNPLAVVAESFYNTYWRTFRGEKIPYPIPDIATLEVLVAGGADVNMRPYIWDRVRIHNNKDLNSLWGSSSVNGKPDGIEADMKDCFIKDANRVLEAFLKAGANPDMLGHPYPFSPEAMKARITDEQAKGYFAKGTRAINEAIEKGLAWESQVDLLLKYTNLDEESLKAAERSNDPAMVKKIQKLWKAQRK
jgi:hypothetical protein